MHQNTAHKPLENSDVFSGQDYLSKDDSVTSIAIIGCGAAGVATLASLVECIKSSHHQQYKINIFEKSPNFGPGLAYQFDSDDLLMNMVSSTTSINVNRETDFWEWVIQRGHTIGTDHIMSSSGISPDGYVSRQFFGLYLKDRFNDGISEAKKINIPVRLENQEVIDIKHENACFEVLDYSQQVTQFDCVILCVGNTDPHDVFKLSGKRQYINNPYPINRYAMGVKKDDSVGIIGGQLTAADIAVVLSKQGHTGPIHFFTRGSNYPLVRCAKENFELKYFNHKNLEVIGARHFGEISLRQALRLARKEFIRVGIKWKTFFIPAELSYKEWIEHLFSKGHMYENWQHFAIASDAVIGDYWNALSLSSKKIFMNKYHRLWMCKRVPLPMHTYLKIYSLFQSGILKHHTQLFGIEVKSSNKFTALLAGANNSSNHIQVQCDWVINATGPAQSVDTITKSPLISNLIQSRLISVNPFGGIELDYETSTVTNDGKKVENFYAIGHLTSGTYFFVSSLDMVALGAMRAARALVNSSSRLIELRKTIGGDRLRAENAI